MALDKSLIVPIIAALIMSAVIIAVGVFLGINYPIGQWPENAPSYADSYTK